ncbi:MAG: TolC family protein [Bacteroidales bacterium]|nr:TolC family protein [Bacteroidales bacterium]
MKRIIMIIGLLAAHTVYSQVPDTLTLKMCYAQAVSRYPAAAQVPLLNSASEIQQKKLNANYLPQVQINGQASYQSDVTKVDVVIPPFYIPPPVDVSVSPSPLYTPVPPKDQYKITMDVYQVIYDGGITNKQKRIDMSGYEIEKQKVEIELFRLKENINSVFFNIILLQENEKLLAVLHNEINNKLADVITAVKFGTALASDRDVLKAELIRVEQQIDETKIQRNAFIKVLAELISEELPGNIVLELPGMQIGSIAFDPVRPELKLYDMQKIRLEESKELITSTWMPKLSGFGQLGYGNPGLNFLEDKWTPFYIVGARLNWQIWNWNQKKKDKQILGLHQNIIDTQRETFDKNLAIALEQNIADISKYEKLIQRDREIIVLRVSIAKTASSRFDNGVITSSDFVSRVNEEAQAKLNLEMHKIQLAKAQVDYLTTLGKL